MKRRAISLLAILAMLCTMVVFALPTTVAAAETYPQYKDHVSAMANGHDGKNWSISEPADWLAMIDTVEEMEGDQNYFEDVTFHLTQNINFNGSKNNTMKQLGAAVKDGDVYHPKYFSGTINGHGFGFDNIFIYSTDGVTTALINQLGNCSFIDFGVNSGEINRNGGNGSTSISTFGSLTAGCTVNFTRVWSGAKVRSLSNGHASALVGAPGGPVEATINVNGFVFDGLVASDGVSNDMEALRNVYGVVGSHSDEITGTHSYQNILVDGIVSNPRRSNGNINASSDYVDHAEPAPPFGMFRFAKEKPAVFENVYGIIGERIIGDESFKKLSTPYFIGTVAQSDDALLKTDALEAAWAINAAQIGEGPDAVYYELNDEGKIRPIAEGKSEGKIIKISVTGDADRSVYVRPGSTIDLKDELGYKKDISFELVEGTCTIDGASVTVGTGDVTLEMTNSCVDHDFDYTKGDKKHTAVCSECNHQVAEDCELTSCTPNELDWNAYTHTGTCDCGNRFSEVCAYEYKETEGGYKYVCSCGRTVDAPAPMVAGDVTEDGAVDLIDAIRLLKKAVGQDVTINERNADVDGDNDCHIMDVRKIILYFMNVSGTKAEFEATEARVNGSNFYNEETIEVGNLKMDGEEGTNERYIRTDYISVTKGNKIVFGPVRKAQAVLGHFYDADGKAIELINVNNERLETKHTFKAEVLGKDVEVINNGESAVIGNLEPKVVDGLEMVSIVAPEGAAYVRLQANAKEEDQFYIRINNEFSLADYQCRTNGDANTLTNEERDQLFLTVGDSLCAAARDTLSAIYPKKGWEGRININFGAQTVDSSQGGTTISTAKYYVEEDPENDTDGNDNVKYCIVNQITMHRNGLPFEYVLIEGGANDAAYAKKSPDKLPYTTKIGYYENDDPSGKKIFNPNSYDPRDFAPANTFIGGLERAIYTTIKTYGDTAAIGYLLPYPMPKSAQFEYTDNYFQYVDEVCQKWKIPYLDLYYENLTNFNTEVYTINTSLTAPDFVHADGTGYDIMQKYIDPFVQNEMRPVDQEIYLEIQEYDNIPQNLNINS